MPAVKGDGMRGLAVFISDIRNCKSKEAEEKRINKELANIRSKFKGDKTLDGYQKKKYVCKLVFIFLLGHDIDFGHMEAVNLLSSNKYTEKQIGYLFISVLVSANSDLMKLVIQSIKNDLSSRNPVHINLALQCISNIGNKEMAEAFGQDIPKLLVSGDTIDSVKQSAALCLLRLVRNAPDSIHMSEWSSRIIHLLNDQHMGVVTAAMSLLESLARSSPDDYKGCITLAVARLSRIVTSSYTDLQDYTYYFIPAPWLSVKLLHLLQHYPPSVIIEDPSVKNRLTECLEMILNKTQEAPKSKKVQHSNAKNAILFEAINLIIHMDCDANLLIRACNHLGQFLQHRETNMRYLALESMCLLATSEFSHDTVKKHQDTVIGSLKTEKDVSVRQRAVDLLYAMCDRANVQDIVQEMLSYLETADYSIREEMVLKVAILAEKYALDYTWYVDTILNLIRVAGDYVSEEVWHRVIQIVVNRDDVQGYAAKTVFEALQAPSCHENMVKVGGYILGEFGNLIAGDPRSSPLIQFNLLHSKFHLCSTPTRQLLLSTYVKFINLFSEIKQQVQEVLSSESNLRNADVEIQQRAAEYLQLTNVATPDVLATVLEEMPPFAERESSILAKLQKKRPEKAINDKLTLPSLTPSPANHTSPDKTPEETAQTTNTPPDNTTTTSTINPPSSGDLLGLAANNANTATTTTNETSNYSGLLIDVLGGAGGGGGGGLGDDIFNSGNSITSNDNFNKFVCKNNGVIFENDLMQIGVKGEFRKNLGRLCFFYGNKTQFTFSNFTLDIENSDPDRVQLQAQSLDTTLEGGAQKQQVVNVQCISEFEHALSANFSFQYSGVPQKFQLTFPLMVNKFMEATQMQAAQFFQRWKVLSQPLQESQVIKKTSSMETDAIKNKLSGFGFGMLEGIDPIPDNFVGAGIIHTVSQQIGCLLRFEPNKQVQMFRLTIRVSKDGVAKRLTDLLETQF